jgi:lipopolysaccharide export system permease protein
MLAAAVEHDGLERLEEHMRGTKAFIGRYDSDMMSGLHIFRAAGPSSDADPQSKSSTVYVYAKGAQSIADQKKGEFSLHLYNAVFDTTDSSGAPKVVVADEAIPVVLPFQSIRELRTKPKFLTNQGIRDYVASDAGVKLRKKGEQHYVEFISEIYRRFGSSFACLAFAFVGVPLGIKARRQDTSTGLVLSLIIGTAYFAVSAAKASSLTSGMILAWAPDVVCVLLGLFLLRRARFR